MESDKSIFYILGVTVTPRQNEKVYVYTEVNVDQVEWFTR